MPWTAYLQRYYLERGGQFVRQKLKDKTPIRSDNLSYNMLVFFKEICNEKSAFKLKTQATDSLISLVARHCYVLKSFLITLTACRNRPNI